MSGYERFAVVGVGHLGLEIAKALLQKYHVTVLTRSSSANANVAELQELGAKVAHVDYAFEETLLSALQGGIEVVICTVGAADTTLQPDVQYAVARACKRVGTVRLFVPNDWSVPLAGLEERDIHPFLRSKPRLHRQLEDIGLDWLEFSPGILATYLVHLLGPHVVRRQAHVYGASDVVLRATHPVDVARFVRLAFERLPASELRNRTLRVSGFTLSWAQIASQLPTWRFEFLPARLLRDAAMQPTPEGFHAWLQLRANAGVLGSGNDNDLVGFVPEFGVRDVIPA